MLCGLLRKRRCCSRLWRWRGVWLTNPCTLRDGTFPLGAVRAGDDVRAETRSGEALAFEVASVEGGSTMTTDAGQRVEAGDLTSLQIVRRDKHKTHVALRVLGGVAVAGFPDQHQRKRPSCASSTTPTSAGTGLRP